MWMAMLNRCKPHFQDRAIYYDKGIRVCDRWHKFENFLEDMGNRPSPHHSIGRIDGSKGYEPGNVRWETPKQQANNTSRNTFISYRGKTLTMRQWSEELGMNYDKLKYRITQNWPLDKALSE